MYRGIHIPLFEMCMCLSSALDLISSDVVDHHKRVAYVAACIADELGLSHESQEDLIMAGLLHDIGAISLKDRLEALRFEVEHPDVHTELGYRMIRTFNQFSRISRLIRFHHLPWADGQGEAVGDDPIPVTCHVLHLADRIAALVSIQDEILDQARLIRDRIRSGTGSKFIPGIVDTFLHLSDKESFWFDLASPSIHQILTIRSRRIAVELDLDHLLDLSKLFGKIIDYRSRFTATHSSGVAAAAKALGRLSGLPSQECRMLRIAGYLHDLGKLAVPAEILEKPARLTRREENIVKRHAYYTFRTIQEVPRLEVINIWASLHHECLDGTGYPFHYRGGDIPTGSRIVAVADVFTALTEDRPYRIGMSKYAALAVLDKMASHGALDSDIVSLLTRHYDEVNAIRLSVQKEEASEYVSFRHG